MMDAPEALQGERELLGRRLLMVRAAALASILLVCVPVPPWEWRKSDHR